MDTFKKNFETALAMGENFVDRNPAFCQTSENRGENWAFRCSTSVPFPFKISCLNGGKGRRVLLHELMFLERINFRL